MSAAVAAVVVVLVAAAAAVAVTPKSGSWKGTDVQLGKNLKFKVSKGGKKVTQISANVLEYCDGSSYSSWTTFAPDTSWKVKNGRFSGRHKEVLGDVTAYFTFKGRFTSKGRAKGVLREETIVAGSVCDTRELKWKAKAR
jgi:hypothetical protein